MELSTLVYVSNASYEMSDDDLLAILDTSREFNKENNISGLLLYRDAFFIQVLEGERTQIELLFERIRKDSRHRNVLKLYQQPIGQRKFGEWAMSFISPDVMALKDLEGFSAFMADESLSVSREKIQQVDDYIEWVLERFRQPVTSC